MAELVAASNNFNGGNNRAVPERVGMNESSVLQNLVHVGGNLTSIDGRIITNPGGMPGTGAITSLERFYKSGHRIDDTAATSKKGWALASRGAYAYLACEVYCTLQSAAATTDGYITIRTADSGNEAGINRFPNSSYVRITPASGDTTPYFLYYTAKTVATGRLTCTVPRTIPNGSLVECVDYRPVLYSAGYSDPAEYASANGRCYIAFYGLYRWDGFYYTVGTVACTGNTTLTGTGTTWSGFVLPGDKVYYCNRNGASTGTWYGPYIVSAVGSDTSITLTGNGQSTAAFNPADKADYIIVRMNNAGIAPPTTAPTLAAATGGTSALDTGAVYKYQYRYLRKISGLTKASVTASPPVTTAVTDAGDYFTVGVPINWTPYSSVSGDFGIRIERTEDGGTDFLVVADYWDGYGLYSPMGSNVWYTHTDKLIDTSLTALGATSALVPNPNIAPTVTEYASGSNLTAGTRDMYFTLYNSVTGTESNPSPKATVTTTAGQQVTITAALTGEDRQADYIRFYSTATDGSSTAYRIAQVAWAAGATTVSYIYTSADADLDSTKIMSNDFDPPPASVSHVCYNNGKMYVWGDPNYLHRGYFSTVGDPEHWARYEWGGPDEPTYEDPTLGGYFTIGHSGDEILAITPSNDMSIASLIVQSRSKTWYWIGSNWVDHQLIEAWMDGTSSARAWANYKGVLFGLSADTGVQRKLPGAMPEGVYEKIFPLNRYPFRDQVTAGGSYADYFEKCSGACWRDYYVFVWPQSPSAYCNKMMMYHIPTGTYCEIGTTSYPVNASCLSVWNGPGDNGELYYGSAADGYIYRLHAKTGAYTLWSQDVPDQTGTGVECVWRSGAIQHGSNPDKEFNVKSPVRMFMNFHQPASDQSITVKAYTRGDETTAEWSGVSKTLSASVDGERNYVDVAPSANGPSFMMEWSGIFTKPVVFEGYSLTYIEKGNPTS
ncbi:MAG: hypothetical protein WC455_11970 [Dehalococcoidia bacterium]|jgi:hypothetical protein